MAPTTEVATFSLTPGANLDDTSSSAGKVWQSTVDTVKSQEGCERVYYGLKVEDQNTVELLIDWDSIESHQKFMKSPIYDPFTKNLSTIASDGIIMNHVNFNPHPPSAAISSTTSPVTEVAICYFASFDPGFEERIKRLASVMSEKAEGFKAASAGWMVEDIEHPSIGSGKKGKAVVAVIGWESQEAHHKFRESPAFGENIHLMAEGTLDIEDHHTTFKEV